MLCTSGYTEYTVDSESNCRSKDVVQLYLWKKNRISVSTSLGVQDSIPSRVYDFSRGL